MSNQKPFDIPSLKESVKSDYENGLISLRQAAIEFYKASYTNFIDVKYARKALGLT